MGQGPNLYMWLSVVFVALASLASYGAAQSAPTTDAAALLVFPFCVCEDYRCATGPYRLKYSRRTATATQVSLCFRLRNVGCDPNNVCCQLITQNLAKLEISVDKVCQSQFIRAEVNGVTRTTYFDDEFATGKIRITALNMNATRADNAEVCLIMRPTGCNTMQSLCQEHDGSCRYATFESSQ
eukprot:CAMPEP_0202900566 /NCGR_PEP_ID=MMETSP1392-20130828/11910_1 /ASSEMBLY_ACC=CAM_ASM_000868 /TAXON_ID=225041 /ORGANISM="Chlamydomonas chlamydogama, Strain SAG 11-48b" /LENGTH=182 /DNA_ID=CAMNT_0049586981 /DNA_START=178 /DNA_END=723 /DNA_ORIENTATION=-